MKPFVERLHFVGIGGAGMSAIAELLHRLGHVVSGSDAAASETTRRLAALGLRIAIGHDAAHLGDAQAVVASAAIPAHNPELAAARAAGLPVLPRAALLAELLRPRRGIAVAGTHGKTTTTSLVAAVLMQAGADPSFVIGGDLLSSSTNARLGGSDWIVVEADESDASFLQLSPVLALVTNIDADHMDTYGHDLARLHGAFADFVHRLPWWGRAVLCTDDPGVQAVRPRLQRRCVGYGLAEGAELRAVDVRAVPAAQGGGMSFTARAAPGSAVDGPPLAVRLALNGEHNVRNALAAIAVARLLKLDDAAVQAALAGFGGVGRRFERLGEIAADDGGHFELIDDYGHHPVEIAAVARAARGAFPGRRLLVAFQPHRYSRTRDLMADFARALAAFDQVLLAEVYAAGEAPIAGADGAALARALQAAGVACEFVPALAALPAALRAAARDGDVVITLGAGSITGVARQLKEAA